jgi:hypothetical protein
VHALGPYRIRAGERELRAEASERDVREGRVVTAR